MTDDLTKALAEMRRVTPPNSPWEAGDIGVGSSPVDYHIATILNAAASGDLIPKADADLAVAMMVEKAATHVRTAEVPMEETGEGAMQRALLNYAADVVSLCAPASALAELQALREERDVAIDSATQQDALRKATLATMRSISAENEDLRTELATLRAQVERLTGALKSMPSRVSSVTLDDGPKSLSKDNLGAWVDGITTCEKVVQRAVDAALTEGAAP